MEKCLAKNPNINLVYTINEPTAVGANAALKAAGKTATIVSVDGGCAGVASVKNGVIGATAQQYPLKMADAGHGGDRQDRHAVARSRSSRGPRLLRHRRRAGDRQAGRGRRQHHRDRGRQDLLGQLTHESTTTTGHAAAAELRSAAAVARCRRVAAPAPRQAMAEPAVPAAGRRSSPSSSRRRTFLTGQLDGHPCSQQTAVVAALAVGQTLVILTAGIDLSVGAIMVLSMMVMATLAKDGGMPGVLALAIGIAVGLGGRCLNGLLVTRLNLPPFIVTLGTLSIFTAIALLYSGGESIQADHLPGPAELPRRGLLDRRVPAHAGASSW